MAAGIILGARNDRRPTIALPPSAAHLVPEAPPLVGRCLAPGCGAVFYKGEEEAWQRHTVKCGEEKLDEIRALAPSHVNKGTIFDHRDRDLEMERHFRKVREDMEREGRMTVNPNERAGFS